MGGIITKMIINCRPTEQIEPLRTTWDKNPVRLSVIVFETIPAQPKVGVLMKEANKN